MSDGVDNVFIEMPWHTGLAGHVVKTKEALRIDDAYDDRWRGVFNREVDKKTGVRTRAVLTVPIVDEASGDVLGVAQFLNKRGEGESGSFTLSDQKLAQMMARHVAIFMATI